MHAEIIAVGTELTSGAKLDTNSQWLSLELGRVGIPVLYHSTVADDLEPTVALFRAAVNRSDLVLITGGLGPTRDDLTRQALAELIQAPLVLHQPSLDTIKQMFAVRHREMPESNVLQAMFPEGSQPLANPRGTAPGIWLEVGRKGQTEPCKIAALPGVPSEMKRMYQFEVLPRLPVSGHVIHRAVINCFGVGESKAEEILGELTARGRNPEVGITVHEATISLRIVTHGSSNETCEALCQQVKNEIHKRMGTLVFGEENIELEHVIVRLLSERAQTLSTVEAGTGGLMAYRLSEVEGYRACYRGGVVVPSRVANPAETIGEEALISGSIDTSAETSAAAAACRARFQTDFALAVSERPQFNPDEMASAAPSLYVSLAGPNGLVETVSQPLLGDLAIVKSRAAKTAFNILRLRLLDPTRPPAGGNV